MKILSFGCNNCKGFFPQKEVEVDHITPIGLKKDFEEWVIELLMGDRQVLCKRCHKKKTKKDQKELRKKRKSNGN